MVASHCTVHEYKQLLGNRIIEQVHFFNTKNHKLQFLEHQQQVKGGNRTFYKIYLDVEGKMTTGNK